MGTDRAVVLLGGQATRLRPLTDEVPKALLPLGPTTLLDLILHWLRAAGVHEVTLAGGWANPMLETTLGRGKAGGLSLTYLHEPESLGSGGAMRAAASAWDTPFWVLNGDIVIDLDLPAMAKRHARSGAWASLALTRVEDVRGYGVVELAEDDRIVQFVEKPDQATPAPAYVNAGVWRFDPAAVALLQPSGFCSVEYDLFPAILSHGQRLQGYRTSGYWEDMGTPERYRGLTFDLLSSRIPAVPGWPQERSGTWVHPSAEIDPLARMTAPYAVGAGTRIAAHATVQDSILWDAVTVGGGADVRESILASGVQVAAGVQLQHVIGGQRARIGATPPPGSAVGTDSAV